jgi:hypothetical protein
MRRHRAQTLAVFGFALALRVAFGLLTYGSVDLVNTLDMADAIGRGRLAAEYVVPYFPVIPAFVWFGRLLQLLTPLPVAFCYKLVPILFDAGIAAFVHRATLPQGSRAAFRAGYLYALSPVAIVISAVHGQWEPIALFLILGALHLRDAYAFDRRSGLLIGALACLSLLVKPIAVPLLPFLIPPPAAGTDGSRFVRGAIGLLGGVLATFLLAAAIFTWAGFDVSRVALNVMNYGSALSAPSIFGLPYLLGDFGPLHLLRYRFALMLASLVLAAWCFRRGVPAQTGALAMLCLCLGTTSLAPQYLAWPLALLLIGGRWFAVAGYTLLCSAFLVAYYLDPLASYFAWENMATFAVLRGFAFLAPPFLVNTPPGLVFVLVAGNLLIPALFLAIFFAILREIRRGAAATRPPQAELRVRRAIASPYAALLAATIAMLLAASLLESAFRIELSWGRCGNHCLQDYVMPGLPLGDWLNLATIILGLGVLGAALAAGIGIAARRAAAGMAGFGAAGRAA